MLRAPRSLRVLGCAVAGCLVAAASVNCGGKPAPVPCDGSVANCSRPYDRVTYAATHDSFAYATGGPVHYDAPNQDLPIHDQLAYGIRTFGIRPAPYGGDDPTQTNVVYVTHNYGQLGGAIGQEPLLDILQELKTFLDANPSEVVTLLAENAVTPQQVADVFTQAGLDHYLFTYDPAKGWPTLKEMAEAGTRLLEFSDDSSPKPAWQMDMWSFIVDTNYNITDPSQFTCDFYRGTAASPLYFLNQFIYKDYGGPFVLADPGEATIANNPVAIVQRATDCWHQTGRIPVFVYVDFYREGDVKSAVDELNETIPR